MQLTLTELQKITFGALGITGQADGFHFRRFTEKQLDYYTSVLKLYGDRARTTGGIRLDFVTDSTRFTFSAPVGQKYDLSIDGTLRSRTVSDGTPISAELTDPLGFPKKGSRVTLWLPAHSAGVLSSVELDDGASVTPWHYDRKILFLGDSITQGWHSEYDSLSYVPRVANLFNADFLNHGVGGYFFDPATLDDLPFDPDWVIVAYGTNDWAHFRSKEIFQNAAETCLVEISRRYKEKRIFVIPPIWRGNHVHTPPEKLAGRFEELIAFIARTASDLGMTVANGPTLVPPLPDFYDTDLLHPNDLGFASYAENLCRFLLSHSAGSKR